MTYAEKLRDPRWQKKRLEILARDSFKCQSCASGNSELHVHHRFYISGRDPWDYPTWTLNTYCKSCHKRLTECYLDERTSFEVSIGLLSDGEYETADWIFDLVASAILDWGAKPKEIRDLLFNFAQAKKEEVHHG